MSRVRYESPIINANVGEYRKNLRWYTDYVNKDPEHNAVKILRKQPGDRGGLDDVVGVLVSEQLFAEGNLALSIVAQKEKKK